MSQKSCFSCVNFTDDFTSFSSKKTYGIAIIPYFFFVKNKNVYSFPIYKWQHFHFQFDMIFRLENLHSIWNLVVLLLKRKKISHHQITFFWVKIWSNAVISQSCSSTSRYLCNNIFLAWLEENGLNEFFCRSQITTLDYHYHHIGWIEHELPWWENMYGLVWYLPTYMFRKDIPSRRCGQGAKMMYLFGSSILISVKGAISRHT